MKILPEPIVFDWDKGNIEKNLKHDVSDKEAEEVFENKPLFISTDRRHSIDENRYQGLGRTNKNRLLFVSFTIRNEKVRIISTRFMSRKERKKYEKIQVNTKI